MLGSQCEAVAVPDKLNSAAIVGSLRSTRGREKTDGKDMTPRAVMERKRQAEMKHVDDSMGEPGRYPVAIYNIGDLKGYALSGGC
jgi:hypothetical protein